MRIDDLDNLSEILLTRAKSTGFDLQGPAWIEYGFGWEPTLSLWSGRRRTHLWWESHEWVGVEVADLDTMEKPGRTLIQTVDEAWEIVDRFLRQGHTIEDLSNYSWQVDNLDLDKFIPQPPNSPNPANIAELLQGPGWEPPQENRRKDDKPVELRKINQRRMLAKAQRLIRKYTQPNPPGMGPHVRSDEGIPEVWAWAEATGRTGILSALAQTACVFAKSPEDRQSMCVKLRRFAEQAKVEKRWKEYTGFLMALAKLENGKADKLALYEESLEIYTRLDDWAGEAICASLAAGIYRYWCRLDQVRRLYLRSYRLWAKAQHKKGIGGSLGQLADLLVLEGRYVDACRLAYRSQKVLAQTGGKTGARDFLNYISYKYKIAPEQYETKKTAEELISEVFWAPGGNENVLEISVSPLAAFTGFVRRWLSLLAAGRLEEAANLIDEPNNYGLQ